MSDADLQGRIGTLDPARAVRIQQAYPPAFSDLHLRHRRGHLPGGAQPALSSVNSASGSVCWVCRTFARR